MRLGKRTAIIAAAAIILLIASRTHYFAGLMDMMRGKKTVEQRLDEYGPAARAHLAPAFEEAGVGYPPKRLVLVGLKSERELQVYAGESERDMRFVKAYPILGASGKPGPKLMEGDCQVPEGIYAITFLNPNSKFHLSLRIGYPNEFDREMADRDGRESLGGDIMIHGGRASVGCLAMGDEAAEDLFVLAADTGIENTEVILSPVDFRVKSITPDDSFPEWTEKLYERIRDELGKMPGRG